MTFRATVARAVDRDAIEVRLYRYDEDGQTHRLSPHGNWRLVPEGEGSPPALVIDGRLQAGLLSTLNEVPVEGTPEDVAALEAVLDRITELCSQVRSVSAVIE